MIILTSLLSCKEMMPESEPFIQIIEAVQTNDISKFKSSFSKSILNEVKDLQWSEMFSATKNTFETNYGKSFTKSKFSFTYDENTKLLIVKYQEQGQFRIAVVKENSSWKINEK